jgi:hypothetical protein
LDCAPPTTGQCLATCPLNGALLLVEPADTPEANANIRVSVQPEKWDSPAAAAPALVWRLNDVSMFRNHQHDENLRTPAAPRDRGRSRSLTTMGGRVVNDRLNAHHTLRGGHVGRMKRP